MVGLLEVRIIAKTGRSVDIQGVNNHRINEIPIVTAGGVITTQNGLVIAFMNQYAYTRKGISSTHVHSSKTTNRWSMTN